MQTLRPCPVILVSWQNFQSVSPLSGSPHQFPTVWCTGLSLQNKITWGSNWRWREDDNPHTCPPQICGTVCLLWTTLGILLLGHPWLVSLCPKAQNQKAPFENNGVGTWGLPKAPRQAPTTLWYSWSGGHHYSGPLVGHWIHFEP